MVMDIMSVDADVESRDTGLGVWLADLPTAAQPVGSEVVFTLHWHDAGPWDNATYRVRVASSSPQP
jgi:hypothetical protein